MVIAGTNPAGVAAAAAASSSSAKGSSSASSGGGNGNDGDAQQTEQRSIWKRRPWGVPASARRAAAAAAATAAQQEHRERQAEARRLSRGPLARAFDSALAGEGGAALAAAASASALSTASPASGALCWARPPSSRRLSSKVPPLLSALALAASLVAPLPDLAASALSRRRTSGEASRLLQPPVRFGVYLLLWTASRSSWPIRPGIAALRGGAGSACPRRGAAAAEEVEAEAAADAVDRRRRAEGRRRDGEKFFFCDCCAAAMVLLLLPLLLMALLLPRRRRKERRLSGFRGGRKEEGNGRRKAEPLEPEPEEFEDVFPRAPGLRHCRPGPPAAEVQELRESLQEAFRVSSLPANRFDAAGAELMRFAAAAGVSLEKKKTIESPLGVAEESRCKPQGARLSRDDSNSSATSLEDAETPTTPAGESHEAVAAALEAAATAVIDSEDHASRHFVPPPSSFSASSASASASASTRAASSSAVSATASSSSLLLLLRRCPAPAAAPKVGGVLAGVIGAGKKRG